MKTPFPLIPAWPALLAVVLLSGACTRKPSPAADGKPALPHITVQLDWVAEPEHGAFYTAEALGYFKDEGLDVTLLQGGPNVYALAKVGLGQVPLAQADSSNVLLEIQSGVPLVNVAAIFQHDPTVLMMQQANPVTTWKDLEGKTIMARPEWSFLPYLRKKYGIQFQVIPHNFDLGRLAIDPTFIEQGYYTAEPFYLEHKGVKLKFLHVADTGFDSYTSLVANKAFLRDHGDQMRAFLRALHRGARYYIETSGAPAHAIMLKINPKVTSDFLDWSRQQVIEAHLMKDAQGDYLSMNRERYVRQIEQLQELGMLRLGSLKPEDAMDTSYLPSPGKD